MEELKNSAKIFYSMNEVAEMFDLTQTQLRNWEGRFPMLKPHRNRKGNRLFTPEDVETLKIIHNLIMVKGLKIDSAVKEMENNISVIRRNSLIIDKLSAIKADLINVYNLLDDQNDPKNQKEKVVYTSSNQN